MSIFNAISGNLNTLDWAHEYAVGPPVPRSSCGGSPKAEGATTDNIVVDPPLGEETEAFFDEVLARLAQIPDEGLPMLEDTSKQCDFNGDQLCDAADVQIFEGISGSCLNDAGYHPQADIDGSGCVDEQDRFHMFEVDRDADGIPDTADNCLTLANVLQEDGDGDGDGDVCDNCPFTANTDQADTNNNGRGDACECGDFDGDGRTNTTDARLIQRCAVGEFECVALGDVTCDGKVNTTDARLIQRFSVSEFDETALLCEELAPCP